jgi:hypothetical protein
MSCPRCRGVMIAQDLHVTITEPILRFPAGGAFLVERCSTQLS